MYRISRGNPIHPNNFLKKTVVYIKPGKTVFPTYLPMGYHDSESNQYWNSFIPFSSKYFVALKLNQGSNSWMMASYFITEKILIVNDITEIKMRQKAVRAGVAIFNYYFTEEITPGNSKGIS